MIFEKFVYEKLGYRQITDYLNNLGYKTKRGNKWENRMIKYMLQNPTYCGYTRWCPERHDTHHYNFEKSIIVKSDFVPIISEELFKLAQERIKEIKLLYRPRAKSTAKKHWLNNLIKCSECGKTLTRSSDKYFQCNGYSKGMCSTSQLIKIEVLEKVVIEQFKTIFNKKLDIQISNDTTERGLEIKELKKQLEKTMKKKKE